MGIESRRTLNLHVLEGVACKKSPQAWGLKALQAAALPHGIADLQKESPSMGIERKSLMAVSVFNVCLAKRVPKHGD